MTAPPLKKKGKSPWGKIVALVLGATVPSFAIMLFLEQRLTLPILEGDVRETGHSAGRRLARELRTVDFGAEERLAEAISELMGDHPSITQVDIFQNKKGVMGLVASSLEYDETLRVGLTHVPEALTSKKRLVNEQDSAWEVVVPVRARGEDVSGAVRLLVSIQPVVNVMDTLKRVRLSGGLIHLVLLVALFLVLFRKMFLSEFAVRKLEDEKVQLFEKIRDLQNRLASSDRASVVSQMAASFAHEVGTPLNAIGMHLQLLERDLKNVLTNGTSHRLDIARSQLGKIETIVKSFLNSTSRPDRQFELINLNAIVETSIELLKPRIEGMGASVKVDLDPKLGGTRCVRVEIEQVVTNLINNALDSLETAPIDRHRVLEFKSSLKQSEKLAWAHLEIKDTGIGMSRDVLNQVFRPFFTTKTPGKGTGLGLPICRELIIRHHGTIDVVSDEGKWTRVTVQLPQERFA